MKISNVGLAFFKFNFSFSDWITVQAARSASFLPVFLWNQNRISNFEVSFFFRNRKRPSFVKRIYQKRFSNIFIKWNVYLVLIKIIFKAKEKSDQRFYSLESSIKHGKCIAELDIRGSYIFPFGSENSSIIFQMFDIEQKHEN